MRPTEPYVAELRERVLRHASAGTLTEAHVDDLIRAARRDGIAEWQERLNQAIDEAYHPSPRTELAPCVASHL